MHIRQYSVEELQRVSDEVGERSGWDFGRMRIERDVVPWDFVTLVASYLRPQDVVLDVGTGGGERLLRLADRYAAAVGVDPDPDMLAVARANGAGHPHVRFLEASAEDLSPVDPQRFDVVLTRHAPVSVPEIDRVIKPGGRFLVQGIGWRNMENVRLAFETGSASEYEESHRAMLAELVGRGWHIEMTGEYDVRYRVLDMPSLIFWFKAIAGTIEVPADFAVSTHHEVINHLLQHFGSSRGIETNEHRTLVIARKPER